MFSPKGYNYTDPAPLEPDGPPKTGLRRFLEIVSQEAAALLKLNLMFLLSCVPVITIPPAVLALNRTIRRMAADRPARSWPGYWEAFKEGWKRSYAAFLLTVLPLAAAGYGARFYLGFVSSNPAFYLPFMLCSTVFLAGLLASSYLYGLLSDGRPLNRETLRLSLRLGLGRPLRAVLAAAGWYGPLAVSVLWFPLSGGYLMLMGFTLPCLLAQFFLRTVLEERCGKTD